MARPALRDDRARRGQAIARRSRRVIAPVVLLTTILAAGIGQTAGAGRAYSAPQAAPPAPTTTTLPTPSTTVKPSGTTTTTTAAATTSTTVAATTPTTAPPLPLFVGVTPPPPAPPVAADPAKVAEAARLAKLIANQSTVLDKLAVRYTVSQAVAEAAARQTEAFAVKLAAAHDAEIQSQIETADARTALRHTAISAYLGTQTSPKVVDGLFGPIYQAGLAHAYANNVLGTVNDRVHVLQVAERKTAAIRKTVEDETRRVAAIQAKAVAALGAVRSDTQLAAATQDKLTAALALVKGDLVTLVNAQRAGMAWQTYALLGGGKLLDFVPPAPLPAQLPEIPSAMALASAQIGKPYVWGATGPDSFDCSGLMQWSFAQTGVKMPRVAADQQAWATPVPISQVQPGDLVFFGLPAHHVALYVGNGLMVDAPHTGAVVEVAPIWWNELSGFGRVHL